MSKRTKDSRLEVIKMVVSQQEVSSQDELRSELLKYGFDCTQTTLSRDLRQLKIVKSTNPDGRYVYLLPHANAYHRISETHASLEGLRRLGVSSLRFSHNIGVLRTLPGHASHLALEIDQLGLPDVAGTVAGDDTIFMVMVEQADRGRLLGELSRAGIYSAQSQSQPQPQSQSQPPSPLKGESASQKAKEPKS